MAQTLRGVDLTQQLASAEDYDARLRKAQMELLLLERAFHKHGHRAVLAFEGRDAAGKGGAIKRLVERMDPRGVAVHPIGAPTADELAMHWLHRFWVRLPGPGRITVFDRSWYGRVLVERVERLATKPAWKRAYAEINAFERMLVDDGTPVVKLLLHISKKEQKRRFAERVADPFTVWKVTGADWRARERWDDYTRAFDEVLARTDTEPAPWHVVPADYKWFARVTVLETVVERLARFFGLRPELPKGWEKA